MSKLNKNYNNVSQSYLFAEIAKRVNLFVKENPDKKVIKLGIGDVTLPLAKVAVDALVKASEEQAYAETFQGYGPDHGYSFAKDAVQNYYKTFGLNIDTDEIFISEGAKSDIGNITEIFSKDAIVLIPDPVYPVYVDTNIMDGREIKFIDSNIKNNFLPTPPDYPVDVIYLCSPNNPTGASYDRNQLKLWVDYAIANEAIILYDAAYEAFIEDDNLPRSIFEIDGARKCAIEFCSLSKTAGFTGVRASYTVVPSDLIIDGESVIKMWKRRQTTKFNQTPYIVQKAIEAVFTPEGIKECRENIDYYKGNAKIIADTMTELGIYHTGGINSPYIWLQCSGMGSWEFFDYLLKNANVVGTPGEGFGENGKGFFRLSGFGNREAVIEAMARIKKLLKK